MERFRQKDLLKWKNQKNRKPLVIRGARQVGKSYLIRHFGKSHFDNIIEVNFERTPELKDLFKSLSPKKILSHLEVLKNQTVTAGKTLIFLDEIQAAPASLVALRYFFEEVPELHVIAAGSLLEFVLSDHDFSMPVGRVEFMHLQPMSFLEFLTAQGNRKMVEWIENYEWKENVPDSLHEKLLLTMKEYCLVGGMPAVVKAYCELSQRFSEIENLKYDLITAYQSDFAKYRKHVPYERLVKVLRSLPRLVGEKVKYVNIDPDETAKNLKFCLNLLSMAQVCHPIHHTRANGVPLSAKAVDKIFKIIFLDVGLMSTLNGLNLQDFQKDLILVNQGKVSEQLVGQELMSTFPHYKKPELFYWVREKKSSSAEVDYLMSHGSDVIPVEVKSGKRGRLKSLKIFCEEKKCKQALKICSEKPKLEKDKITLMTLPFYLVSQWERFVKYR